MRGIEGNHNDFIIICSQIKVQRCSETRLKIIESMACSEPVVSTTIGAEGLGAEEGRDIFIVDTPQDFAEKVVKLINDEELQKKMGESAYRFVNERFGFKAVRNTIHQMIADILAG